MNKVYTLREGGILWTVNEQGPPQADSIESALGRLNKIEALCKEASPIKQNMYRAVYCFRLNGAREGVYVKRYSHKSWKTRLLSVVFPTQAQREWRMMREIRERGLPVPLPIALGQKKVGAELTEYLVTQEIPASSPIRDCPQWEKDTLLKALAVLTTRLHKNNIFLRDFQLGNILLSAKNQRFASANLPQARPELYLIDLHSARCVAKLNQQQRIWMLAKLLDSFEPFFDPHDKERFLELYARGMPDFRNEFNINVKKVMSLAGRIRHAHLKSRTRRCLQNSTSFTIENHSGWKVYRRRNLPTEEIFQLLRAYEGSLQEGGSATHAKGIKSTNKTHLRILEGEKGRVCIKHYLCSGTLDYTKGLLGLSRARRAWVTGNGLVVRGVATAQPLALVESPEEAFLLSRALMDFPRLDYYILENFRETLSPETPQKKRYLINALAKTIRLFHDKEIYHGDLKACNILVEELPQDSNFSFTGQKHDADSELIPLSPPLAKGDLGGFKDPVGSEMTEGRGPKQGWQFYLIDYDRVVFDREISLRRRAKNLAQLHTSIPWCISRTDRMRFYNEYSKGLGLDKKPFLRKVLQFSASRIPVIMEPIE